MCIRDRRYIARFDNPPMENISTGFYMVDYAEDQQFRDHLSDGYTLEALFMNDLELTGRPASNEFSILSSLQGGGTQLGIANYGDVYKRQYINRLFCGVLTKYKIFSITSVN